MKKSISKIYAVLCALGLAAALICICCLTACAGTESGDKYTYSDSASDVSEVTMNGTDVTEQYKDMYDMSSMYDTLYQGSYILVGDSKLTWVLATGDKEVLNVTMDGDKYIMSGDYLDTMKEAMESLNNAYMNITIGTYNWHGVKTDDGFDMIIECGETVTAMSGGTSEAISVFATYTLKFVK